MISALFDTWISTPLYNALVALIAYVPFGDVGVAVIILTVLVKILLFPFARRAIHTQAALKRVGPEMERIKKEFKEDQQKQVERMLALYKENGIRPFSSFFVLLAQIPIIFGLYWVFSHGGLPVISMERLYSFVPTPETITMNFLGLIDMSGKSILLAILAGATQFLHAQIAVEPFKGTLPPGESMREDMMRSLSIQTRYVLPFVVGIVAYTISAAVALYWATSNTFTLLQELLVRRGLRGKE